MPSRDYKKGSKFTSKSGKSYTLAEDPKRASNGATYAKTTAGRVIFLTGCSKEYLDKIRSKKRKGKKSASA
tara:strand:- start:81 stop:293 length:213 start_codon:yes stop_codon:yes gene_type:complete